MLLKFAAACDESHATSSQCKAYLGAVVVWLYACDGKQAWAVYQVRTLILLLLNTKCKKMSSCQ